jgi:hypothetical protein
MRYLSDDPGSQARGQGPLPLRPGKARVSGTFI